VPAAAVIPALIAYTKVVVVKTPVVDFSALDDGNSKGFHCRSESDFGFSVGALNWVSSVTRTFTLKKLECLKQAFTLEYSAWDNGIGLWSYFVGFEG
jgi:hypothetical protein